MSSCNKCTVAPITFIYLNKDVCKSFIILHIYNRNCSILKHFLQSFGKTVLEKMLGYLNL